MKSSVVLFGGIHGIRQKKDIGKTMRTVALTHRILRYQGVVEGDIFVLSELVTDCQFVDPGSTDMPDFILVYPLMVVPLLLLSSKFLCLLFELLVPTCATPTPACIGA